MKARVLGLLLAGSLLAATALAEVPQQAASRAPQVALPGGGDPEVGTDAVRATGGTKSYPFYPLAGNLGRDIFVINYVDLDPGPGVKIYDCSSHAYNGHDATDTSPRGSFVEQEIGIPVYAALDGYVTRTHDGEPDHNTVPAGQASNYVQLYHGGGHVTGYLHLKNGSVGYTVGGQWRPWQEGDFIRAGTQIGLMASSGNSAGPHLHFSSHLNSTGPPTWNGTPYEPNAGACDPGASDWRQQVDDPTTPIVYGFTFSPNPFTGSANPPEDQAVRTGSYVTGVRTVYFRADVAGVAVGDNLRIRYVRPDSSVAADVDPGNFNFEVRGGGVWWGYNVNLDQIGTWKVFLEIDGTTTVQAPFEVVESGEPPNRPPLPVQVSLDPAQPTDDDAVFCRITSDPAIKDLDYDAVRYRWVWQVDGVTVRDVVTAGRADAIPHHVAGAGDNLSCAVTANDGTAKGPTGTTSAAVLEGVREPSLRVKVVGNGRVTSAAGGIKCPSDCAQAYAPPNSTSVTLATTTDATRSVTLKASPGSKTWRFSGWSGACAPFGLAKTCTITVATAVSAKATFKKKS